jgi:phosphinothricin acetyltransferase
MADYCTVRQAAAQDWPAVCDIVNHYIRTTTVNFRTEEQRPEEWQQLWQSRRERFPWLVAERHGEVTGLAYAGPWNARHAYAWSAEVTVYIAPGQRGAGIGRALYSRLLETLVAQWYRTAVAIIALPNEQSVTFHEALGFVHTGILRGVGYKFGSWHDTGFWQWRSAAAGDPPAEIAPVAAVWNGRTLG